MTVNLHSTLSKEGSVMRDTYIPMWDSPIDRLIHVQ